MSKTEPFSIRLGTAAKVLVEDEMRRSGRSRSAIVEELAEEAAKTRLFPGIAFRDTPRRAWVVGTGLDVWELIEMLRSNEGDTAALRENHPLVNERHVRVAQAYAQRFPDEIEQAIAENNRPLEEWRALFPFVITDEPGP